MQLLQKVRHMTREFPPFVRGMGPEAAYWSPTHSDKPTASIAKGFIELLEKAKVDFITVLAADGKRSADLIAGFHDVLTLQSHIQLHPARERELFSAILKIAGSARKFGVPLKDRVSFIEGKIRFQPMEGAGDFGFFIYQAAVKRIACDILAVKKTIAAQNFQSAFEHLLCRVSPEQVVSFSTHDGCGPEEVVGVGTTQEAATAEGLQELPEGAKGQSVTILREEKQGVEVIQALTEFDARRIFSEKLNDARVGKLECVTPGSKGFLGIGRKNGRWEVSWKEPFKVAISFHAPIRIRVRFVPEK